MHAHREEQLQLRVVRLGGTGDGRLCLPDAVEGDEGLHQPGAGHHNVLSGHGAGHVLPPVGVWQEFAQSHRMRSSDRRYGSTECSFLFLSKSKGLATNTSEVNSDWQRRLYCPPNSQIKHFNLQTKWDSPLQFQYMKL